jgi:DNA-binding transcriptional regulator YdaS (Cro superfamily)
VGPEPALDPCYFDNDLFMRRTSALLGADAPDAQRAALVGIVRSSLNRLRTGDIGLSVRRAKAICRTLDVTVDELFPERDPAMVKAA